jgi:protein TonB
VKLDKSGSVISVEISSSSGFRLLDQAALDSLRHARFAPALRGGKPVAASVIVPIRFQLSKGAAEP